jgi:Carboxypeptidase regulatory-like domain/TonB-dependent Receptor Plug Domain
MLPKSLSSRFRGALSWLVMATMVLAVPTCGLAQTTISQGSIQGSVTDPSGALVPRAQVTISDKATGQVIKTTTSSAGTYSSGALLPGRYTLRVEAKGFKSVEVPVTVQVAVTSAGNVKLELGRETETVEVQVPNIQVNTEQSTVQGVLTADQIDKLPIDGRNFLDLAQLEPGVQIQDGQTFDPTKAGYSSISINGVNGRNPRIELDGLDISDETVGTTTQNVALGSIEEFNISRSNLDLSTELTSSGAVNITTRSGTNAFHGQGFYNFRDRNGLTANFAGGLSTPYQRNQFGGRFGGSIIKDKLFFFLDAERTKQDAFVPVLVPAPFSQLSSGFPSPFRDTATTAKLDWQVSKNVRAFYRLTYNWNKSAANFGYDYQVFSNRDNAPSQAAGLDWNAGSWSHSFRFGYLKFHNLIGDGTKGASFYNPTPTGELYFFDIGTQLSGPNLLAPQQTFQSNKQFKYDGSKVHGAHVFRFGAGVNRILGGGFASFFGVAPLDVAATFTGPVSGSASDPTNYPLLEAILGNGQGFFTEKPQFGFPSGGQDDWRFQWYVGDSWKVKPNITLSYGLRYNRDSGRSDSDMAPIPCSAVSGIAAPCTGSAPLLDQFGPGLGGRIHQPNTQFGPQVGVAWDPFKNGKTVFRAGAGLYYENSIFNNTLFDRPAKLAKGLFFQTQTLGCAGGGPGSTTFFIPGTGTVSSVDGVDLDTGVCFQPLSIAAPFVSDLQKEYQAGVAQQGPASNPSFVGNTLEISTPIQGLAAFAPNFRNARSYQINAGIQRELWRRGVLSADYIRNVSTHFMLTIDANHVGDARFLDMNAANNAIANTLAFCQATSIDQAISVAGCPTGDGTFHKATITDFAGFGIDSGNAGAFGGGPANLSGAAFGGINRNVGQGDFEFPSGRSVYNALQMSYKQEVAAPMRGIASMNLTVAYTLSRFVSDGGDDQNFSAIAFDNVNPGHFTGPTAQDRTHQFKWGVTFDVAHRGPRFSVIGNFASAAPTTLRLTAQASPVETSTGEIFFTDLTGDGTAGDTFPSFGKPGQFGRSVSASGLTNVINSWNSTQAGTLTPAGQALVNANLFTVTQLQELGAVKPSIAAPPAGEVGNGTFQEVSTVFSWPIKLWDKVTIEPSIAAFNVFNFANFGRLDGHLSAVQSAGNVNGTTTGSRDSVRIGTGSGIFSLGAARQVEFGLKLTF